MRLLSTCPLITWFFGRNSGAERPQKHEHVFAQVLGLCWRHVNMAQFERLVRNSLQRALAQMRPPSVVWKRIEQQLGASYCRDK